MFGVKIVQSVRSDAWCSDVVSFNPACRWCLDILVRSVIKIPHIHWVHSVGYLYIMDLINARKMEHIKIQIRIVQVHTVACTYESPFGRKHYTWHGNIVLPKLRKRKLTQRGHNPSWEKHGLDNKFPAIYATQTTQQWPLIWAISIRQHPHPTF